MDINKVIFDLISQLVLGIVQDGMKSSTLTFFEKRKVERRVEDATAEVIEGIIPFLNQEKIPQEKQERLIENCIIEMKPLTDNPAELFKGSLDGQKIFDNLYQEKELPKTIIEDGLRDTYTLLFPRIATLVCKIPAAVKDWENEAWSENYKRFDEIVGQLKSLFARVDELATLSQNNIDSTLNLFKRTLSQKIGLQLDLTGLRSDQPLSGKFDDYFVLPEIKYKTTSIDNEKDSIKVISLEECFDNFMAINNHTIVIGAPGAGKSTWSKWLQKETIKSDWDGVVIRVEFRELLSNNLPSVHELIRKAAGIHLAEDLSAEKIRNWLENSKLAFIFDGFDEVKPIDRDDIIEWLKELNRIIQNCPCAITSRPLTTNHLQQLGENWKTWHIEPFDEDRVFRYIKNWYTHAPLLIDGNKEIDASMLAENWLTDKTIEPLTSNPLLLSTLLIVHHLDGKLPSGRSNLYKRYIDGMLGIWDDRHKLSATNIQLSLLEKRKIVQGIAIYAFQSQQETIDENILIEWLSSFFLKLGIKYSPSDVLLILSERSGLIVGPGVYSFSHKTISEFLVAEAILEGDQYDDLGKRIDRFYLFENRNDDRWNTVLFLWAGMTPFSDLESFVQECINEQNWALAYGLIFDQYERFSVDSRRKFILKINSSEKPFPSDPTSSTWTIAGYPMGAPIEFTPPFAITLRSLTTLQSFDQFVRKLIVDNTISWSDFSKSHSSIYDAFWLYFSVSLEKENLWKEVLDSKFPESLDKDQHIKLIANWCFTPFDDDQSIEKTNDKIKILSNAFPEYRGYIPISLMTNLIWCQDEFQKEKKFVKEENFKQFVKSVINVIEDFNEEEIGPYLIDTKKWTFLTYERKQGDLLNIFKGTLDKLVEKGMISNIKYETIIRYVGKLKKYRKTLLEKK